MAKKKKKGSKKLIIGLVAAVLVILGVVLFVTLDVAKLYIADKTDDSIEGISGLEAIFGYKESVDFAGLKIEGELLKFSFLNFLPLILILLGLILVLLKNKLSNGIGSLVLIVGAVLMIFAPKMLVFTEELKDTIEAFNKVGSAIGQDNLVTFKAQVGAYLGAVCVGLGGITGVIKTLVK